MKILKPGPSYFYIAGTITVLLFIPLLIVTFLSARWMDLLKEGGMMMVLPALILGPIIFLRIEVAEQEIRIWNFGRLQKRARFDDIGYSTSNNLVGKGLPVSMTLYGKDGKSVLMTIPLKMLKKEDITWIISYPQLTIKR
jgi:hypothetical protein